ncbi:uncharacterized protein LOC141863504 [Acropora palmata]|uniref:uncharacterized protein LOC141863504 n=1 Tax=Acropora palmata TaxID=6131 RepID=UPI003DA0A4E5
MIFFALFVFTAIVSVNSAAPFIEEDEATASKTVPEKRGYTWSCYRTNYYCQCRANFRCYYYGYYGRKCCGWVYQQPGCSRCQESQCCSNNVCKPLRKPGQACPLKGADRYFCDCVQGYECKPAGYGPYWGKCVEESGSGMGANLIS